LKSNKDLIIKPADNGGAIVVMNKKEYDEAINQMLQDKNFYSEQPKDLNSKFSEDAKKLLGRW
jgi:biotin carboxylase